MYPERTRTRTARSAGGDKRTDYEATTSPLCTMREPGNEVEPEADNAVNLLLSFSIQIKLEYSSTVHDLSVFSTTLSIKVLLGEEQWYNWQSKVHTEN